MSMLLTLSILGIWYFTGLYLIYKSMVAFRFYLHKEYTIVEPFVKPPKLDIIDCLAALTLGPIAGLVSWGVISAYLKRANISLSQAWSIRAGRQYFK